MQLRSALFGTRGPIARVAYGGRLKTELLKSATLRKALVLLDRAGRAIAVDDLEVERETKWVEDTGLCRSNDSHVIGLARAGNVRLLCSLDRDLHADFTNKSLIDNPRGKVYKNDAAHLPLLRRFCS